MVLAHARRMRCLYRAHSGIGQPVDMTWLSAVSLFCSSSKKNCYGSNRLADACNSKEMGGRHLLAGMLVKRYQSLARTRDALRG
jgi:hypothetical protein